LFVTAFGDIGRKPHNRLVRLNPATLHVTRTLTRQNRVPIAQVYGARSLWVTDISHNRVLRVDPTTFRVVHATALDGRPWGLAFGHLNVWVTVERPGQRHSGRYVLERIDSTTGDVTGHTVLHGTAGSEEVVVGDVVAVAGWHAPHIQLVDPTTMHVVRSMSSNGTFPRSVDLRSEGAPMLGAVDGQIYLRKGDSSIVRLAADGPQPTVFTTAAAKAHYMEPGAFMTMSSAAGLLWVQGSSRPYRPGITDPSPVFYGIDPVSGRVTAVTGPASGWVAGDTSPGAANGPIFIARGRALYRLEP
jgi:hypothetical protein